MFDRRAGAFGRIVVDNNNFYPAAWRSFKLAEGEQCLGYAFLTAEGAEAD